MSRTHEMIEPDINPRAEDAVTPLDDRVTTLEKIVTYNITKNERTMKKLLDELKDHSKEIGLLKMSAEEYEQGMQYIKDMFAAMLEIKDPRRIDLQKVSEFEAYSNLGFTRLLQSMHIGISDGEVFGIFANAVNKNDTNDACRGWTTVLTRNANTIFHLINRLKPILNTQENASMDKVERLIHSFMRLFHITL